MADPLYSEKEAQEILNLATRRATAGGGMTRERLIQAASEMGISASEILAAEQEVKAKQQKVELRQQFLASKQKKFFGSFSTLVGTSITLYGISFLTSGWHGILGSWAVWPCGFMALAAAGEAWEFLSTRIGIDDGAFEKWQAGQERKARLVEREQLEPGIALHVKIARKAYAEHGPEEIEHIVDEVREKTGLKKKEAKALVESVSQEPLWIAPVNPSDLRTNLSATQPVSNLSLYENARTALEEAGPNGRSRAIALVQTRTGLSTRECEEAVDAVSELHE